jgi:hypothetical protein
MARQPGVSETSDRRRHRGPSRPDDEAEDRVREVDGHQDAIGPDPAEAVRHVPERDVQASVDRCELCDYKTADHASRAIHDPSRQTGDDLREVRQPGHDRRIEHRELKRFCDTPSRRERVGAVLSVAEPRLQDVAGSEQFAGRAVTERNLPDRQAPGDEQSHFFGRRELIGSRTPMPDVNAHDAHDQMTPSQALAVWVQICSEVRIEIEETSPAHAETTIGAPVRLTTVPSLGLSDDRPVDVRDERR